MGKAKYDVQRLESRCREGPRSTRSTVLRGGLLRDRLRLFQVRRDPDDREGPGGRRIQVAALLVDARVVQLRTGLPDAVLVDLQLFPRLRMGSVPHRDDVFADRRLMRELE